MFLNYCQKDECATVHRLEEEAKNELEFQLKDSLDFVKEIGAARVNNLQAEKIEGLISDAECWSREDLSKETVVALDSLFALFLQNKRSRET